MTKSLTPEIIYIKKNVYTLMWPLVTSTGDARSFASIICRTQPAPTAESAETTRTANLEFWGKLKGFGVGRLTMTHINTETTPKDKKTKKPPKHTTHSHSVHTLSRPLPSFPRMPG